MTFLLDPTSENNPVRSPALPRPSRGDQLRVGLLDISKRKGDIFLDELARLLSADGLTISHYQKPTHTRPAPIALQQQIAGEVDLVVEALAD